MQLSNSGQRTLQISSAVLSDTKNFQLHNACSASLAPGAVCDLAVSFTPTTLGSLQATLTLTDNSGGIQGSQQTVNLSGTGLPVPVPQAALTPGSLRFASTMVGRVSTPQEVMLLNAGTGPLAISSVVLAGPQSAAFRVQSSTCGSSLAVGSSCTVSLAYAPTSASLQDTAMLVVTDDAGNIAGATQSVTLAGSTPAQVDAVENFGDSITCAYYAQPQDGSGLVYSNEGYAGLFDAYVGVPSQNWCRPGDTAADLSRQWVPLHSAPSLDGHQLYTLMIGTNDAYRFGVPAIALQTYTQEVSAALAWLALPAADKVLPAAMTQESGRWTADVGTGLQSMDTGAALSFHVNAPVADRNLYLVYHVWSQPYGSAGKASISVDGVSMATVDESSNSGVLLPTENGTADTFLAQTVPLGAAGEHTITFTSTGPDGATVGVLWAGVAQKNYVTVEGAPRVLVGLVPNSPSGNQTYAADVYNLQLKALIPAMVNDGLQVQIVTTDRVLDAGTDFADILHPNSAGHAKLAAAFEQYR